jgi:hypothetical protein
MLGLSQKSYYSLVLLRIAAGKIFWLVGLDNQNALGQFPLQERLVDAVF